jgi:hypothetical protein
MKNVEIRIKRTVEFLGTAYYHPLNYFSGSCGKEGAKVFSSVDEAIEVLSKFVSLKEAVIEIELTFL